MIHVGHGDDARQAGKLRRGIEQIRGQLLIRVNFFDLIIACQVADGRAQRITVLQHLGREQRRWRGIRGQPPGAVILLAKAKEEKRTRRGAFRGFRIAQRLRQLRLPARRGFGGALLRRYPGDGGDMRAARAGIHTVGVTIAHEGQAVQAAISIGDTDDVTLVIRLAHIHVGIIIVNVLDGDIAAAMQRYPLLLGAV
ncbi:MAG: hypothetical protein BWY76_01474 [bacterium ADurb.Bin429]|nr:MAG: hypothetical protein BWY76_01474 [bacterium ADurb.Bin429]